MARGVKLLLWESKKQKEKRKKKKKKEKSEDNKRELKCEVQFFACSIGGTGISSEGGGRGVEGVND